MKKQKVNKSLAAGYKARILQVYSMIMRGADRPYLLHYGGENWRVSARQIDTYIAEAHKLIQAYVEEKAFEERNKSLARRQNLFRKAYSQGDYAICHEILKDMDKLRSLYPIDKHEFNWKEVKPDIGLLRNQKFVEGLLKLYREMEDETEKNTHAN